MKKQFLALAGLVVAALALSGCGASQQNGQNAQGGQSGNAQLVVDTAFDLTTLDPGRMNEPTGTIILRGVYETALRFKSSDAGSIEGNLADYELSPDNKVLTLTVRKGPTFADGKPVTVDDMVFSYQRLIGLKGNPANNLAGVTVEKVSDTQLTLTSAEPMPELAVTMANPSLGIMEKSVAEEHGATTDAATDKAEGYLNTASVGSGPYTIEKADIASQVTLVANPKYWGEKPGYSRIVIRNVAAATQLINIKAGTANIVTGLSSEQATGLPKTVTTKTSPSNQMLYVLMNQNPQISKWTSNPDFVKAVREGIDYKALLDIAGPGSVRAAGVIAPMIPGALKDGDAPKTDVAAAKKALAASGYAGEEIKFNVANDMTVRGVSLLTIAESIQDQLKKVGINFVLDPAPTTTALGPYRAGEQAAALWYVQPSQPHNFEALQYLPGQQMGKRAGWPAGADPTIETLGEKIRNSSAEDALPLFTDFQEQLNDHGPFVTLLLPPTTIVTTSDVAGLVMTPTGEFDITQLHKK